MLNLTKLKEELYGQINSESQVESEKVERYLSLVKTYRKLQKAANKEPMIIVRNGTQEYTKVNPAIGDMNKISGSLIALGKDIGLSSPPTPEVSGRGYSVSDLT